MSKANATHPSHAQLTAFVAGKLAAAEQALVEAHVAQCAACCDVLRSLPHETLIHRLRPAETSAGLRDTSAGLATETDGAGESSAAIPVELVNHARYRIVKQLGAGGMGVVFQAEHRLMERAVALKVINRRLVNNPVAVERFHLEVKAAASLAHRNIVTAYDAEQAGDVHFLVMEFVEGISLSQLVEQRGRLSAIHACNYAMQAAQGLQHASEHGMVHRDIKPQNLMRTTKGIIKILDFGLARLASQIESARLTRVGVALGTADYIAPEQVADSRSVDIRADIYSLGCTLYYLLTEQVPFPSGTLAEKVLAHMNQDPVPLADLRADIPPALVQIVQRMMAKEPADRFPTPGDVATALKPFSRPDPPTAVRNVRPSAAERGDDPLAPPSCRPPAHDAKGTGGAIATPPPPLPPDPFSLPFDIEPAVPPSKLTAPKRSRRKRSPSESWRRLAGALGIVVLLAVAGLLFPIVRNLFRDVSGNLPAEDSLVAGADPLDEAEVRYGEWIELTTDIDLENNAIAGTWQRRGHTLSVGPLAFARLAIATEVPQQYDLEVSFTRETGSHSIAIVFVAGSGQATFEVDAWEEHLAGIQNVGGQTLADRPVVARRLPLQNGERYTALIQVRQGHVIASLNGQPLATYQGDGSDLAVLEGWRLPDARALGIGAYESATTFHQLRIRHVDAAGN